MTRAAASFALLLTFALPGCGSIGPLLAGGERPTASIAGAELAGLRLDGADLVFDVEATNPYAVDLPVVAIDYELGTRGISVLSGSAPSQDPIPAGGSKVLRVPVSLRFADVMSAVSGVTPGSVVPYAANIVLSVEAPAVGPIRLPLSHSGEVPIPAVPGVELTSVEWERLSIQGASAVATVRVTNTNQFGIDLERIDYGLSLAGTRVASASLESIASIGPGRAREVRIPFSIAGADIGIGLMNMLSGASTGYDLDGAFDAGTPFGDVTLPFSRSGQVPLHR